MADIESEGSDDILALARRQARDAGYLQRAQVMLAAAGIAAFAIVAVAGTMLTTLL